MNTNEHHVSYFPALPRSRLKQAPMFFFVFLNSFRTVRFNREKKNTCPGKSWNLTHFSCRILRSSSGFPPNARTLNRLLRLRHRCGPQAHVPLARDVRGRTWAPEVGGRKVLPAAEDREVPLRLPHLPLLEHASHNELPRQLAHLRCHVTRARGLGGRGFYENNIITFPINSSIASSRISSL